MRHKGSADSTGLYTWLYNIFGFGLLELTLRQSQSSLRTRYGFIFSFIRFRLRKSELRNAEGPLGLDALYAGFYNISALVIRNFRMTVLKAPLRCDIWFQTRYGSGPILRMVHVRLSAPLEENTVIPLCIHN